MTLPELKQKFRDSFEKLLTLEIVTVVGTYDAKTRTPGSSSKMIRTRLDLLQGDKVTEFDEAFTNGALTELRDYHAKAEASGHAIITSNLATLEKLLATLGRLA